jgi:hypothetical protein
LDQERSARETVYLQGEGLPDNGCELITKLTEREIVYGGYRMRRIPVEHVDQSTDD